MLQAVANNIKATTFNDYELYFGLEAEDVRGIEASDKTGWNTVVNKYGPGYSDTIQTIYEQSNDTYFFHANDDFEFLPDWDKASIEALDANPGLMVVGVHDGNDSTNYWTISMIRRQYIEKMSGVVDMPNRVFYPYNHNYIDTEFSQTAIYRGVWDKVETPCIKHHHPGFGGRMGRPVSYDDTYAKNDATAPQDGAMYAARRHLFT